MKIDGLPMIKKAISDTDLEKDKIFNCFLLTMELQGTLLLLLNK